jgi:hypothetical protein
VFYERTFKIACLVSEKPDFEHCWTPDQTPNSPKMAAILGEFGVHQRIQSPIFQKPNMQFSKFAHSVLCIIALGHYWGPVIPTVASWTLWTGEIPLLFSNDPNGSFRCMDHRQSTRHLAFDKPIELYHCTWAPLRPCAILPLDRIGSPGPGRFPYSFRMIPMVFYVHESQAIHTSLGLW